jgi:hypothetical protein
MVNSESLQFFAKVNFLTKKPNLSFNSRLKELIKIPFNTGEPPLRVTHPY